MTHLSLVKFRIASRQIACNQPISSRNATFKEADDVLQQLQESDIDDVPDHSSEDEYSPCSGAQSDESADLDGESPEESDSPPQPSSSTIQLIKCENNSEEIGWTSRQFNSPDTTFGGKLPANITEPMTYFSKYISEKFIDDIANFTNIYSVQECGKSVNTTGGEIRHLFALHIMMGIIPFPRLRLFWSPSTKLPLIDDIGLSRNRFEKLRNCLHVVDTTDKTTDQTSPIWRVKPIVCAVQNRCRELVLEENVCITESLIPFKVKLSIKQYNKSKPRQCGVKVFVLCGSSGIVYDLLVYEGSTTVINEEHNKKFNFTDTVVMTLCDRIPSDCGYKLFMGNHFASIDIMYALLERKIFAAGTIQPDRTQGCPFSTDNELCMQGRGTSESKTSEDGKIALIRWYDNKPVTFVSNFVGVEQADKVRRWDRAAEEYIDVNRPAVARLYNQSMGGVDKLDFLVESHRTFIRSSKWPLRVIFHFVNLAVVNSWLEYCQQAALQKIPKKQQLDLLSFTMGLVETLVKCRLPVGQLKRGRPSSTSPHVFAKKSKRAVQNRKVVGDIRYDNIGHDPVYVTEGREQRCKLENCTGQSRIKCSKCKVFLCLNGKRNCYRQFHVQ